MQAEFANPPLASFRSKHTGGLYPSILRGVLINLVICIVITFRRATTHMSVYAFDAVRMFDDSDVAVIVSRRA